MFSDILYQEERELLRRIVKEKGLFHKLFLALKLEAIAESYTESISQNGVE